MCGSSNWRDDETGSESGTKDEAVDQIGVSDDAEDGEEDEESSSESEAEEAEEEKVVKSSESNPV